MAKELLDGAEIRAGCQQVGGKTVPQTMGRKGLGSGNAHQVTSQQASNTARGEARTPNVPENWTRVHGLSVLAALSVLLKRCDRRGAERRLAGFGTLTENLNPAPMEIDLLPVQTHGLTHAKPSPVKALEECSIAKPEAGSGIGCFE